MTSLDREVRQGLGVHLRLLRQAQGLTLAELAAAIGVTASAVSQIERGVTEPSLGTLWSLGRALNASLFDFFAGQEAPAVDVVRLADRTVVEFGRLRYEMLARSAQRSVDLFTMHLQPGEGTVRQPVGHAGEEAGVVLSGEMEVTVAGTAHRLAPGDAMWFDSAQPHTFATVGDEPCVSVWTDTLPNHAERRGAEALPDELLAQVPQPAVAEPASPGRPGVTSGEDALATARDLPLDAAYLREIVEHLARVGSAPLGFRTTGTPEDREVADYVAAQLRDAGLDDVAVEDVAVDGWRFERARLSCDGLELDGSALGGTPATPPGGVCGRLLDAKGADRRTLDRLDLQGAVVLVDWRKGPVGPSDIGLELGLRGAVGMVMAPGRDGPFFQAEGALGAFDGRWHAGAPPMMLVRRDDAAELRRRLGSSCVEARLEVRVQVTPGARGHNAVGYLPGEQPGPIVVGAHHDGWFRAAFDNATGVAAMLAIARALAAIGHRPRHRICFTSRTAEEYGLLDRTYDWCVGAWRQVDVTHPEWAEASPFHLCLEASGHPGLRVALETPPELTRWARRMGRAAEAEGWLTSGWRTSPPVTGTEQWPLLVSGVPGVAAYTWETAFARGIYHTPLDTPAVVDVAHLERLTRFYAFMLLSADRDPDGILDHAARGREVVKRAAALGGAGEALQAAAKRYRAAGRAAFTDVGRTLHAVRADGSTGYPHDQAAADVAALEAALTALAAGDHRAAAKQVAKVGDNVLATHLSHAATTQRAERLALQHADDSWAARSHLTTSPDLWLELAALRGEPGARQAGAWIERSLTQHLARSRAELARRVAAMTRALEPSQRPDPGRSS